MFGHLTQANISIKRIELFWHTNMFKPENAYNHGLWQHSMLGFSCPSVCMHVAVVCSCVFAFDVCMCECGIRFCLWFCECKTLQNTLAIADMFHPVRITIPYEANTFCQLFSVCIQPHQHQIRVKKWEISYHYYYYNILFFRFVSTISLLLLIFSLISVASYISN